MKNSTSATVVRLPPPASHVGGVTLMHHGILESRYQHGSGGRQPRHGHALCCYVSQHLFYGAIKSLDCCDILDAREERGISILH